MNGEYLNTGMIYLLDAGEVVVAGRKYRSVGDRKKIISEWRRLYAAAFSKCFLQISPVIKPITASKKIEFEGNIYSLRGLSDYLGINRGTLRQRIKVAGASAENIRKQTSPKTIEVGGISRTVREWASISGIDSHTIHARIGRGWSMTDAVMSKLKRRNSKIAKVAMVKSQIVAQTRRSRPTKIKAGRSKKYEYNGYEWSIKKWAKVVGMSYKGMSERIKKWGLERAVTTPAKKQGSVSLRLRDKIVN